MVRVVGPIRVVTDRPLLVSQVRVRAARDRAEQGGLTAAFDDAVPVTDGQLDMVVLPGPAVMMLEVTGGFSHAVALVVPDVAEATLEQCVTAAEVAGEADRRTLERLAGEVARDAQVASDAARSAGDSAIAASEAADRAALSATGIDEARAAAASSAQEAAQSATGVTEARDAAAQSASEAQASEQRATQAAGTANADAATATEQARAAATSRQAAESAASTATSEADRASASADRAEKITLGGIPDATEHSRGVITLAGDISGTADSPTVPGLAEKLSASEVSTEPTGGVVVRRGGSGEVAVPMNAVADTDAASKAYVDATSAGLDQPMTARVSVRDLVAQNREGLTPSHPYADPSGGDVEAMLAAVDGLLQRGEAPAVLPDGVEVIEGWDDEAKRAVWVVRSTPGNGLYWGLWVLPHSAPVSAIVESPHPVFDGGSDDIAYEVWRRSPLGTVLAVAGSHRTNPDGTDPRDVCKNKRSMWHQVTTHIAQPGLSELQIHGFGDSSLPGVGAVVSSGSSPLSAGVLRLDNALRNAGVVTARQWDGSATKLIGMFNAQGDAAAIRGNAFCHIELSGTTRDSGRDVFVQAVTASGYLANRNSALITNEYPRPVGSANSRGEATTAARADHTHRLVQNDPADGEIVARDGGGWRSIPAAQVVQTGGGYTKPADGIPLSDQEQSVQDAIQLVKSATYSAIGGALMKRTSTGAVSVAEPTAGVHAANRNYVDGAVSAALGTARAYADTKVGFHSHYEFPNQYRSTISTSGDNLWWGQVYPRSMGAVASVLIPEGLLEITVRLAFDAYYNARYNLQIVGDTGKLLGYQTATGDSSWDTIHNATFIVDNMDSSESRIRTEFTGSATAYVGINKATGLRSTLTVKRLA